MLWLALFSQAEHFQSVRRKGDGDSGAAEVEDRLSIPHEKDRSEAARRQRGEIVKPDYTGSHDNTLVDRMLASLPPNHGITQSRAGDVLSRVRGDFGAAVEILLEEMDSDSGSDHRVDEMLSFRMKSPVGTVCSESTSEGGAGTGSGTSITTPSSGENEGDKPVAIEQDIEGLDVSS